MAILFFSQCNKSGGCLQLITVNAKSKFQKINDSLVVKDTTIPMLVLDYDTNRYIGLNSNTFTLPINSNADSMRLLFATDTIGGPDHLVTLSYTKQLHFVSKECGYNYFYTITDLIHSGSLFKKVQLLNNSIDENSSQVHFIFTF
jgi:hypothetical protein